MTPFEAYQKYIAIRNHFTLKSYDYFKYNGKVRTTFDSYNQRKDKWVFEKLSRVPDLELYLVANFVNNQSFWIGDFEQSEVVYKKFLRRQQSLSYSFEQEIYTLGKKSIRELIEVKDSLPFIIDCFMQNHISLEVLVIFADVIGCTSYWNKQLKNDIIWNHYGLLIKKYRPFLQYDKKDYLSTIKKLGLSK